MVLVSLQVPEEVVLASQPVDLGMHVVLVSPQVPEGVVPPQSSQTRWRMGQWTASDGGLGLRRWEIRRSSQWIWGAHGACVTAGARGGGATAARGADEADRHVVGARDRPQTPGRRSRAGHGKFGENPAGIQPLAWT